MKAVFRVICSLSIAWVSAAILTAATDLRLIEATKNRDKAAIRLLLKQNVDVNSVQPDGATALHWAAYWNDTETADLLITRGAKVNVANDYGATPLWVACSNRHTDVVRTLLAANADPNKGLLSGETVLMRCSWTGDPAAVEQLLVRGAEVDANEPKTGQTALMWAIASVHPEVTRALLARGASLKTRTAVGREFRGIGFGESGATEFYTGGFTPLLFAARHNDVESARLLLDAGADVNEKAADGNTPLVLAAMSGHGSFAAFLLQRGADPNAADGGYTALHAAVLRSDVALVKALSAKSADPNIRMRAGSPVPRQTYQFVLSARDLGATPYGLAAKFLEPEIMRLLLATGADPAIPMNDGRTPLMAAVGIGVRRPYSTDRRDRLIAPELIAAEWANEDRVLESVKVAIEAGGNTLDVNQSNTAGDTALHAAASHGYRKVLDLLVARGGSLGMKNKAGATPQELLNRVSATTEGR